MNYEVEISESAEKSLMKVPKKDRIRIIEKIDSLENDPLANGCKKLQGQKNSLYRIRSGDYRVIYTLKKEILIVLVVEIGHRRDIYQ